MTISPAQSPAGPGAAGTASASRYGATVVSHWELLARTDGDDLSPLRSVRASCFEMNEACLDLGGRVAFRALDVDGQLLRTSAVIRP